jgi:peptide/nickel transport system substrate-binding protein
MMSTVVLFAAVVLMAIGWQEVAAQSKQLAFTLDAPPYRQLEAQAIAEQLKKIGIQAEARIWEKIVLRDQVSSGDRNAYLTDWGSAYFDPFDLGEPKLTTGGRGNFSFYANPKVDEWLKMASNSADNAARKEAYFKVQATVFGDAPWIFGYCLQNIEAASANVENWGPAMDNRVNLHDVKLKKGDTIIVGMNVNAFVTLDPAMHRDRDTETVIRNMFDGLVTRTNGADVLPELAEGWEEVNPTTYVFTLRPNVKFHNGDPLTADDVVFTFERVLTEKGVGGQSSPRKGLLGPLQKVAKMSDRKVKFELANPFPPFMQALVHFQIVPQKYIKEVGDKAFAEKPIGTGPFKFVKGKLDAEVVMERFEGYSRRPGQSQKGCFQDHARALHPCSRSAGRRGDHHPGHSDGSRGKAQEEQPGPVENRRRHPVLPDRAQQQETPLRRRAGPAGGQYGRGLGQDLEEYLPWLRHATSDLLSLQRIRIRPEAQPLSV